MVVALLVFGIAPFVVLPFLICKYRNWTAESFEIEYGSLLESLNKHKLSAIF